MKIVWVLEEAAVSFNGSRRIQGVFEKEVSGLGNMYGSGKKGKGYSTIP
jgi:hypothetical protein